MYPKFLLNNSLRNLRKVNLNYFVAGKIEITKLILSWDKYLVSPI